MIMLYIGVISVQGAISEHVDAVSRTGDELGLKNVQTVQVRKISELDKVSALIIPGGESTTISKLITKFSLFGKIIDRAQEDGLPIMGTCAGSIVLAKEGDAEVEKTETQLLKLMDMRVIRNAFGRQAESFESDIKIEGFNNKYHAVFIRAPVIEQVWGDCKVLAKLEDKIVLAQQDHLLAAAFHPELTSDMRLHKYFLEMV